MSNYFSYFPSVDYDIAKDGKTENVVDILRRFIIKSSLDERTTIFYDYDMKDGDRPDTIAHKYYGDSKYDWIVLMFNNIIDPFYDFALSQLNFEKFITSKYGSIAEALSETHHFEQIIRQEQRTASGIFLKEIVIEVDLETFTGLPLSERREVDNFTFEERANDAKRTISIIDKKYLQTIIADAESVLT